MVTIGIFLAEAFWKTESQPSELSGAITRSWTPWSIRVLTSVICLSNFESALVVFRLPAGMPSLAASSLMDCVSAIRNGLASFSDCEKPIVAVFRSIFVPPNCVSVQLEPAAAADFVAWAAAELSAVGVLPASSDFAQPDISRAAALRTARAGRQRPRRTIMLVTPLSGRVDRGAD